MCVLLCKPLLVIIFLFRVVREIPVRSMEDYKNGGCGWGRGLLPGTDYCISFDVFFLLISDPHFSESDSSRRSKIAFVSQ